MTVYSVRDWEKLYETAETRKIKRLSWVPTPNKHDGNGYRRLMAMDDPGNLFAAFRLIVEVASKMPTRGVLEDRDGPLDSQDLQFKTGFPAKHFEKAFQIFSDPQHKILWLDRTNLPERAGVPAESPETSGRNRIEQKGSINPPTPLEESPPSPPSGEAAPDEENPSRDHPSLKMLVDQFRKKAKHGGSAVPIYGEFRVALADHVDSDISKAIEKHVTPRMKVWEFIDILYGRPPRAGPEGGERRAKPEIIATWK